MKRRIIFLVFTILLAVIFFFGSHWLYPNWGNDLRSIVTLAVAVVGGLVAFWNLIWGVLFKKDEPASQSTVTQSATSGGINVAGGIQAKGDVNFTLIAPVVKVDPFQPPLDLEPLRSNYITHLRNSYRALDFKGIPQLDTFTHELLLEEVYVPLLARPELPAGGETWERRLAGRALGQAALPEEAIAAMTKSEAAAPLRVEEALGQQSRMVVLGDPGSGKSTLLKHLALRLASESRAPLPILLPLNAYAEALKAADLNLQAFLPQYFASLAQSLANLAPLFADAIAGGQAVILLDGLDEVQSDRSRLVQKVAAFAADAVSHGCKVVVTSRIVGYRESPLDAKDWTLYTLLDFDRPAIETFASQWCRAFEKSTLGATPEAEAKAETERRGLLEALDANPGVARLASNPLLLTILALIKRQGVTLPNHRVELYEVYLKTLISAWSKARALDKRPVGPPLDYLQTVAVLGPLALWLRQENPTAGLVSEERLIGWLTAFYKGKDYDKKEDEAMQAARSFLDSIRRYSNLLLERGQGRFGFIHLTFEEALAARGLVRAGQLDLNESLSYIRRYLTDPAWRETILLAVGVWGLVREQPEAAGAVLHAMLQMECGGKNAGLNVLVAGACLEDVGELGVGRAAAQEVTVALLAACRNRALPPAVQRDAGFSLGRCDWQPENLDAFIPIPAGEFLYGEEKRCLVIAEPYSIAKYPVTNKQYRRFIEEGRGYARQELWSAVGWAWRTGTYDSRAEEYLKDWLVQRPVEKRSEPWFWHDSRWNNPLAPVVGMCWFEAEAYCNWLAEKTSKVVRLPDETEWERAARGVDGHEYPWGNTFERTRLNCAEFWAQEDDLSDSEKWRKWIESDSYKLASTTMVGQFPEGNSPDQASDMSGNIWEWTNSWFDQKETYRVVRSGAWDSDRGEVRCSYRVMYIPVDFYTNLGFRVVFPGYF